MSEFVKSFKKQYKTTFDKYDKFIEENDWSTERSRNERESGWKIEEGLVKSVLNRLSYFVKKAEGDMHLKVTQTTIELMRDIIYKHLDRVDAYVQREDITQYTDKARIKEEIDFQDSLFSSIVKMRDTLSTLPIDNTYTDSLVVFYDNNVATLPMRRVVENTFFKVRNKVETLPVDWDLSTSSELYINMKPKDIPPYNPNKHYWEQDESTLQFWAEEFNKIKNGININGYHLSPWLYFHGNFFKAKIPTPEGDQLRSPFLRDNEWFFNENYEEAYREKKILAITGSRRFSKTTMIASQTHHKSLIIPNSELLVAGGSAKDLGQVEKNIKLSANNIEEPFRVPFIKKDWTDKAVIGLKSPMHTAYEQSKIHIINLNKGGNMSSELLAGYTPDSFILDEYLKFLFLEALEAAKPAFQTPYGWRCVPILTGTGGNEDLSQDALKMLSNPGAYDVLVMNWDRLNNMVDDPEYITWQNKKFGTFVPAQMSVKDGIVKRDSNLQEFLKSDNKELSKVKLYVTDWKQANEVINADRKKKEGQPDAIRKEKVYYPIDTDEIFLSGKTNPFPAQEAKKHKDRLISEGNVGKAVDLFRDADGKVVYELSNKEYPIFPFPGGFHDSPVTIYEEPPENPDVTTNLYIAGLDDYKHESSDGDSLGSMVIYKRTFSMGEWDDRIVASYHSRPDPHAEFHRVCWMLLEMYGARCFPENEDMDFKTYLDKKYLTDKYLVKGISFLSEFNLHVNNNREFGWQPTTKNKRSLLGQTIAYTKEDIDIKDKDGVVVKSMLGVNRIPDIKILNEIINYKEGGNFDGITAFMSALGYAHYLDSTYQSPRLPRNREEIRRPPRKASAPFGRQRFKPF
jgi:hypothetical protein